MSKYLWVAVLFLVLAETMLPGQSIAVTSPKEGEIFRFGQVCLIAWTKSGAIPDTVAIRLRRAGAANSEPAVLEIAGSTANDGSFSWPVPASLAAGSYFVRVKAPGSASGDSKAFTVAAMGLASQNKPGSPVQPKGLPPGTSTQPLVADIKTVDFEMLDVERETGSGVIFAKLRNKGSRDFNGPLTFQVFFGNDVLDPITVPVNLAAGATARVNLMYYLQPRELAVRGSVLLRVVADYGNQVGELNEQNNTASRTIAKTCPVYIESFQIDISPSHSTGPYPLPVNMTLRLQVIGQGELEIRHVSINNASGTNKFQFPASGSYVFNVSQPDVLAAWLVPNAQKPNCRWENAICPVVFAWVVGPCADGGMVRSNEVPTRYELPQ